MPDPTLVPTQGDRDAAAAYGRMLGDIGPGIAASIREGKWDDQPRVQHFAQHALTARHEGLLAGREALAALEAERDEARNDAACLRNLGPDWFSWENDLKRASTMGAEPISDELLDRFRHACADNHCKSSAAERHEVEYRVGRFAARYGRAILARLDAAEATLSPEPPRSVEGVEERASASAALIQAALDRWKALPEDERNGERPYIMGFNAGWDEAIERARPAGDLDKQARELLASVPHDLLCPARTSCGYCRCHQHRALRALVKALGGERT